MSASFSSEEKSGFFLWKLFFGLTKTVVILLVLVAGALLLAQSSVSPVSVRLLTSYGMEYAVSVFKPCRHWFPEPYFIETYK